MYLLTQLAIYLCLAFALGVVAGYGLWRMWGQRDLVAKFHSAEIRLASYMSRLENSAGRPPSYGEPNWPPE